MPVYEAFDRKDIQQYNGKLPGLPKVSSSLTAFIVVSIFLSLLCTPIILALGGLLKGGGLVFFVGLLYVVHRLTRGGQEASIRTALFANDNHYSYSWQGGKFKALQGLGSVLGEPMMSNVVTGHFMGQQFTLCGTYSDKLFKTVMRVELPNNYPHIVLDSRQNDRMISSLLHSFPDTKEIVLEGDFPNYFKVYSATNPVETLQILSPELMGRMIDYTHRADIEIVDNQLLLICNFTQAKKATVMMLFEAVEQILKDIGVGTANSRAAFDSQPRL